ncbi:MAG: alpha/beta hydrolase [Bacteroidales bacterium]|nr:alpha/beta hydrolase [Bacteroidales bacterium]
MLYSQINIWEGTKNQKVELTPYLVSGIDNVAVIICPGGSYFWHDMITEGREVAQWLNQNGISAFVLKYRTAHFYGFFTHYRYLFRGVRYPDPLQDLVQALAITQDNANKYGIDKNTIGVMGFSAGGHLVMSLVEFYNNETLPAFIAPIYPVVTMSGSCTHKRSRRALLGESRMNNKRLRDSLSLEKHIPDNCPPVFLVNCLDDPTVQCRNSELLDSALEAKNISHKYIQYKTGGHGFGASNTKGTEESRQWKSAFIEWLKEINLLNH